MTATYLTAARAALAASHPNDRARLAAARTALAAARKALAADRIGARWDVQCAEQKLRFARMLVYGGQLTW